MNIEQEIEAIKARNLRVEADKAWETSWTRAGIIVAMTYLLASLVMWMIGVARPLVSSLIPTLGFFLSVQSLPIVKKWWVGEYVGHNLS